LGLQALENVSKVIDHQFKNDELGLGRDRVQKSQNFLRQILKIFVTLRLICEAITDKNRYFIILFVDKINLY
jgi:hypothetical protein